ncbi:MAG TPA: NfeD family protein [Gemmataceae bacterium]|nr:NfeD family protein [Gemmataceae bacterium]
MTLPPVGAKGYLAEALSQFGYVLVDDVPYPARTEDGELDADQWVLVVAHDDARLVVRAATANEARQAAPPRPTGPSGDPARGVAAARRRLHRYVLLGFLLAWPVPVIAGLQTEWAWIVPWLAVALGCVTFVAHVGVNVLRPDRLHRYVLLGFLPAYLLLLAELDTRWGWIVPWLAAASAGVVLLAYLGVRAARSERLYQFCFLGFVAAYLIPVIAHLTCISTQMTDRWYLPWLLLMVMLIIPVMVYYWIKNVRHPDRLHKASFLGFLLAYLLPAVVGVLAADGAWFVPWLAAALPAVAAAGHLTVDAVRRGRRAPAAFETAERWDESGAENLGAGAPGGGRRLVWKALPYGLFLAGIVALPAGEVLRLARGWPINDGWHPQVVGPGDNAKIYFPTGISQSVNGYWSATGTAAILNAQELNVPPQLGLLSNQDTWGGVIVVSKDSEKTAPVTLWAKVELPNDPSLRGKNLRVQLDMTVVWPQAEPGGEKARDASMPVTETAELRVADDSRAGQLYYSCYWLGLAVGALITLAVSVSFCVMTDAPSKGALPQIKADKRDVNDT